jgi:CheY-like chemotaxis protein
MLRILLVEDDPDVAAIASYMLEHVGHHVTLANDGRRGLEIALQERPEVVITDFMMPGMSGLELITRLRDSGYDGPVVLCSAIDEPFLPPHSARYEVFLKKPYDLRALMQSIEISKNKK